MLNTPITMNKTRFLTGLSLIIFCTQITSQTLFTYGKNTVDAAEFLRAYNKNNTSPVDNREQSIRNYLDLYINSKLKIAEAYSLQLDTSQQFRDELSNIRSQIIENYMTDPETFHRLLEEAFERGKKDIHLAHIFVPFSSTDGNATDGEKINAAYEELKKGTDFSVVAKKYSQDPSVNTNGGDIGYITVFTLPYQLENVIYQLPARSFSRPFTSKAGYHIFKNLGERPDPGKIRVAQLLLAFPPGADNAVKLTTARLADSLYQRLINGEDFSTLAKQYSNDYVTAPSGGIMPEFTTGTYDPVFEEAAFQLKNDGAISKPVLTQYGYHIIKRITLTPYPADNTNKPFMDNLTYRIQQNDRADEIKDILYTKIISKAGLKETAFARNQLWAFTDSLLDNKHTGKAIPISNETILFSLGDRQMTALDWISFARSNRYKRDGSGIKNYPDVMDEFKKSAAMDYYRQHLEDYNREFRQQMNDFRDGNLFFEIMMRQVWSKAQTDTMGLMKYYNSRKDNYQWGPSADVVMFYCADSSIAASARKMIGEKPADWKTAVAPLGEKVTTEETRYDLDQFDWLKQGVTENKSLTGIQENEADESAFFAYIRKVYKDPAPKTFEEAKGLVINDYQDAIDREWTAALRKKYPVKIHQKTLQSILK